MNLERIIYEADVFCERKTNLRETAYFLGISKSALHKHLRQDLNGIDEDRYVKVCEILDENIKFRHIRGGNATKSKFQKIRESKLK